MANAFHKSVFACAVFLVQALILGGGATARADLVIYSTGVDNNGNVLAAGALDTHYTVSEGPYTGSTSLSTLPNTGISAYVVNNAAVAAYSWAPNTATSAWISPDSTGNGIPGVADFIYTTTFNLTGFDPSTASLQGLFSGDDGVTVYLNGTLVADYHYTGSNAPWRDLPSFSITTGFIAGINTLQFVVPNSSGPGGLQFQVTGGALANLSTTPEPSTLTLAGIAFVSFGLMGASRCRRQKQVG
jgi:PEP-CTERM motif